MGQLYSYLGQNVDSNPSWVLPQKVSVTKMLEEDSESFEYVAWCLANHGYAMLKNDQKK